MAGSYIYFANLHHLTQQTILLLCTTGTKEKLMFLNQKFCFFFVVVILQKLLSQKVGTTRSSAAQHYAQKTNRGLAEHLERFTVPDLEEGIARLRYINNVAYKQNQIYFFFSKKNDIGWVDSIQRRTTGFAHWRHAHIGLLSGQRSRLYVAYGGRHRGRQLRCRHDQRPTIAGSTVII
jgi:hypothetical protein